MSRPAKHTIKQLRWIALGGVLTYYTEVVHHLRALIDSRDGLEASWPWSRIGGWASAALGGMTVVLFLYLLLLPKLLGRGVEYSPTQYRNNDRMKVVIPVLTATIFFGWSTLVTSLYLFSPLGFILSVLASSGLYILSFGVIGVLPFVSS
ncbi:hypothetical protein M408DRAFT_331789 [Serendipita vermifera MAFF 305830]|uniref:Uncharacterized protein n=1 Tax=Serendipita vermifera MAFF 305830 TaxID=933852 RepID=A0A0C3AYS2_SERVB|nr:hypothetical protein M408DRAFT_331789 [Serendipita vermifera MAFF 305830]